MAALDDETLEREIEALLHNQDADRQSLIGLLQKVQGHFGYLPRRAMLEVARIKAVPASRVYSVASFYNQFRFVPPGRHPVKVCLGTACHIKGGEAILKVWESRLGISEGETTPDRLFSLERVACIGCCALAPVNVVGTRIEPHMTPMRVEGILLAAGIDTDAAPTKKRATDGRNDPEGARGQGHPDQTP